MKLAKGENTLLWTGANQPVAANLLDRQFEADAPNQRWVGDATEMLMTSGGKF